MPLAIIARRLIIVSPIAIPLFVDLANAYHSSVMRRTWPRDWVARHPSARLLRRRRTCCSLHADDLDAVVDTEFLPLIGSPPALERLFIASRRLRGIVAGRRRTLEVAYSCWSNKPLCRQLVQQRSSALASFRSSVAKPSVNQP